MRRPCASILALMLLTVLTACGREHRRKGPEITTPYAAILLDNGQVYYGKLVNADSRFPELKDVYYVQSQVLIPRRFPTLWCGVVMNGMGRTECY